VKSMKAVQLGQKWKVEVNEKLAITLKSCMPGC
jgi:hypothetical protein